MEDKSVLILQSLLFSYHGKIPPEYSDLLPKEEKVALLETKEPLSHPQAVLMKPEEWVEWIHYSWFKEVIEESSKEEIPLLISSVSKSEQKKLAHLVGYQGELVELSSPVKHYFQNQLFQELKIMDQSPREFLEKSPLFPLTSISKEELIELIDLLGIYDLASEVRQIVDKKSFKKPIKF